MLNSLCEIIIEILTYFFLLVMTMTFFFKVTDTGTYAHTHNFGWLDRVDVRSLGSWLEIGQTISFFCVASLLLVWSAGICTIGEILMARSITRPLKEKAD